MLKLAFILPICSLSLGSNAQQNLRDPRYIYSLDEDNRYAEAIVRYLEKDPGEAVLYKDSIYKDISYPAFYLDSGLVYHDIYTCFTRRQIRRYTKDKSIKILYVVGEFSPARKFLVEHPDVRRRLQNMK